MGVGGGAPVRAEPGVRPGSRGGFEGDFVAECFELGDEAALAGDRAASLLEVVGSQVGVGLAGGEQVPDDDQDRAANRDDGLLLTASSSDPPVAFAEEVSVFPADTAAS